MSSKTTPAPWHPYHSQGSEYLPKNIRGANGLIVCTFTNGSRASRKVDWQRSWEADANLIAAAPALLAGCKEALECFQNGSLTAIATLEAAINAAEAPQW